MVIVKLMGGMGNQMFQYAAALRLATKHKTTLKFDLGFLLDRTPRENFTVREFDLAAFNLGVETATEEEIWTFRRLMTPVNRSLIERVADKITSRCCFIEERPGFDPRVINLPQETYLEGYFQHENYFSDIADLLRGQFQMVADEGRLPDSTRRLADQIRSEGAVCLHVRRGDFANNPEAAQVHLICTLDYYRRGIEELRARGRLGTVCVFSDDPEWCRVQFRQTPGLQVVGVEHAGPHNATHLWLMTLCKSFVISNSSFGWWAAWLANKAGKLVIIPPRWFNLPEGGNPDICPPDWIRLAID